MGFDCFLLLTNGFLLTFLNFWVSSESDLVLFCGVCVLWFFHLGSACFRFFVEM